MKTNATSRMFIWCIAFLVATTLGFAQDSGAPANGGWRRVGDPPPNQAAQANTPPDTAPPVNAEPMPPDAAEQAGPPDQVGPPSDQAGPPPEQAGPPPQGNPPAQQMPPSSGGRATMDPNYSQDGPYPPPPNRPRYNQPYGQPGYGQPGYGRPSYSQQGYGQPNYNRGPIPAKLTIKPGTFVTVRLNQGLSSDRNHVGDGFAATLSQPVVVDGVVVAERGQTVGGKVSVAEKAGRVSGVSHLGVQLTDLTLADGQPVPLQTQLFTRNGPTSVGSDVATVAGTTGLGAAIGAAANWGTGAAVGAGAGLLVGLAGVLLTRGHPTYLYPEQVLTFRVEAPVTVSTEGAPQAFRWVMPGDYGRDLQARGGPPPRAGYYGGYGYPYAYPYAYGGPYYYGPSLYVGGWGWGWGGWGWGGRWGRGWRR